MKAISASRTACCIGSVVLPSNTIPFVYHGGDNDPSTHDALAQAMKEMTRRTDACWRPADIIQHQFAGSPIWLSLCTHFARPAGRIRFIEPQPAASVRCRASETDGMTGLMTRFSDAGIGQYFVWVSPGRTWIGASLVGGTPVLRAGPPSLSALR
jgi:hypothetical protein